VVVVVAVSSPIHLGAVQEERQDIQAIYICPEPAEAKLGQQLDCEK